MNQKNNKTEFEYLGKKNCGKRELDVYCNHLKLNETEMKLFAVSIGQIISDFYKDPKNLEEFKKQMHTKQI